MQKFWYNIQKEYGVIYTEKENNMNEIEEAYKRGYHHGFVFGRTQPDVTENEVRNWRYSNDDICPPGSPMEGISRRPSSFEDALNSLPLSKDEFDNIMNE